GSCHPSFQFVSARSTAIGECPSTIDSHSDYALPNEPLGKLRDDAGRQQIRLCRLENRNGLLDVGREQPSQSLAGLLAVKRNERSADLLLVLQEPVEVRLHGTGVVKE